MKPEVLEQRPSNPALTLTQMHRVTQCKRNRPHSPV